MNLHKVIAHRHIKQTCLSIFAIVCVLAQASTANAEQQKVIRTLESMINETPGMLHLQLYRIITIPVATKSSDISEKGKGQPPMLKAHLKYQLELEEKGIMFAAGPIINDDEKTWGGEGMIIIRAPSLSAAKSIAAADPMHASGARTFTVSPWLIAEGGFTLKVRFSDGNYTLE